MPALIASTADWITSLAAATYTNCGCAEQTREAVVAVEPQCEVAADCVTAPR
jgi:hypothetical protein